MLHHDKVLTFEADVEYMTTIKENSFACLAALAYKLS